MLTRATLLEGRVWKMITVHDVLAKLPDAKPAGRDKWKATCPAHEDSNPSLSISIGEDQPFVLHCFAGCAYETVLAAIDLEVSSNGREEPSPRPKAKKKAKLAKSGPRILPAEAIEAVYQYQDQKHHHWTKVRISEPYRTNDQKFIIAEGRPDGTWKPISRPTGTGPHLYKLELLEPGLTPVWLTEGERDCDILLALGMPAVSVPNGASSWRSEHAEMLGGLSVMIAADNDKAGSELIEAASSDLLRTCRNVRSVRWPVDAPVGYDISDHVEAGAKKPDFEDLWSGGRQHGRFTLVQYQQEVGNTVWAWDQRIAQGQGIGIVGNQAEGKTLASLWFANHFVTGNDWAAGMPFTGRRGRCLLIETEAKISTHFDTLQAWKIELSNITLPEFEPGDIFATPNLHDQDHLDIIERELASGDYGVVVVDSINGGIMADENDARQQAVTRNLVKMGQRYNVTVIIVGHVTKGLRGGELPELHHVRGTSGLTQSLSNIQGLWRPDLLDDSYRGLVSLKYSYQSWPGNLGFTLTARGLEGWGIMRQPDEDDKKSTQAMVKYVVSLLQNHSGRMKAVEIQQRIAQEFGLKEETVGAYRSRYFRHWTESERLNGEYYWRLKGLIPSDMRG